MNMKVNAIVQREWLIFDMNPYLTANIRYKCNRFKSGISYDCLREFCLLVF